MRSSEEITVQFIAFQTQTKYILQFQCYTSVRRREMRKAKFGHCKSLYFYNLLKFLFL